MRSETGNIEEAGIEKLRHVPIDDVLATMDQSAPTYRELYYGWERQQWEAGAIDLSEDRDQWRGEISPDLKRSLLWVLGTFYVGHEQATRLLVPFLDAAPTEEHQVFLATQLVDVARHTVLSDLFHEQVVEESATGMESRFEAQAGELNTGSRTLLLEILPAAAERIRDRPADVGALVEGVLLHHIVAACLASSALRFLVNFARSEALLPGLCRGLTMVARDLTRHVGFGVRFLTEMAEGEPTYLDRMRQKVEEITPVASSCMEPPNDDATYFEPLPFGPKDLTAFAMNSLSKRLATIGIRSA